MGFFKYIERLRIKSELKEQRDIFNSQNENVIKQFRQKIRTPQETETKIHEWEMDFRKWFIENYIIPKYFA